ncbi:MAG: hypothetical protein JSS71_12875 [Armatimonadetes bacterium]|nr:hypothetical protein [Armatimonadota bacterium]MBX3110149.1 hypothetical protein [Fimbriimonadaceae bacterium]
MKRIAVAMALLGSTISFGAGGMVFTDTINNVRPDHPSLAGTFWGWNYHTNLSGNQVTPPSVFHSASSLLSISYLNLSTWDGSSAYNSPSQPGRSGYMVFDRHDTSIDFHVGASIRAQLEYFGGYHQTNISPVPGMMMGLQDRYGRFFAVGFAEGTGAEHYLRIINNPFTGEGTDWVEIPHFAHLYYDDSVRNGTTVELVIAGSRASVLVSGRELRVNGTTLTLDAGPPLNSLIFTSWQTYGGAIVGDYCLTSSGWIKIYSLSYY